VAIFVTLSLFQGYHTINAGLAYAEHNLRFGVDKNGPWIT